MLSLPRKAVNLKSQVESWVQEGLSLNQVAEKLGASKTWVIEFTQAHQIEVPKVGRITNPDNYRHHTPPFGYKKKDGRLIPNQNQQRVCKLIVQLRKVNELSFRAIAKEIISGGHLNGKGGHYWDHKAVKKIYENWKNKY